MPYEWIGTSMLTDLTEISVDGTKIHDLLEQNDYGGDVIDVDESTHPVLRGKMTSLPNMTPPEGSHKRYKIIADKT